MKNEVGSVSAAVTSVLASLPWWAIIWAVTNGTAALLGLAGTVTATVVSGWVAPALLCASVLLIGRSFYVIYVKGVRTSFTVALAWASLVFIVSFWTWHAVSNGWFTPCEEETAAHKADETPRQPDGAGYEIEGTPPKVEATPPRGDVTFYVEGMAERQGITWETWTNKVQEALSGLPGVETAEADWKKDLVQVRYDPARVTVEQMLRAINQEGFTGKVKK